VLFRSFTRHAGRIRRPGPVRTAILVTALGIGLAACGGDPKAAAPTGVPAGKQAQHTLSTVMGSVKLDTRPRRVVVLDTDALDSAVTLGVTPVGATTSAAGAPVSTYLAKDAIKGVKPVGIIGSPDLEAIAVLKPDVILGSKARDEKSYQALSEIAPTVFTNTTGPTWRANFRLHAAALGKAGEVKGVESRYTAHTRKVVAELGGAAKAKATTVAFVRFVEGADTRLYLNDTFVGSVFKDLGVGRPADQDTTGFSLDVSPEQIDKADADVVFHSTYGDAKKAKETEIVGGPLWKKLTAVRSGATFAVDDDLWMLGIGYTGAGQVLDQIAKDVAGTQGAAGSA
jgi:iron complex transport system substrate-binding protein